MDFLFEIGLEEVPARMIAGAQAELQRRLTALLERERLVSGEVDALSYSTPRRLAVLVRGVAERQEDLSEEITGPAIKIAYKDGVPGPAAVAFAKKNGVEVEALKIVSTPKGEYIAATSVKPGRSASEVIAADLPKELAAIYWAKNMVWRAGKPERFVRPVRWLVALLGDEVVPVSFGGYEAGRVTYGHRVLFGAAAIEIASPESYLAQLSDAFVMANVELRRHTIRKALDRVCRTIPGTRWREDHALVDKMTHLTEWPSVIAGNFEPDFLALPEEVLVTVMRDHQNEFAVETEDGKLAPHFLAVLNTVADEAGEAVIRHGNERVLRARFNDARFFWEFDQRIPLAERVALLENVTFQKDLGSYAWKTNKTLDMARKLGEFAGADKQVLLRAAILAKTDLTCELVKEFTELQGKIGGLYAAAQEEDQRVADAIYYQYSPASAEDPIPPSTEGQILGLSDRFTTIADMFRIGLQPTGSRDPFALRRAGNAVVRLLAEGSSSSLTLWHLFMCMDDSPDGDPNIWKFFNERTEFYLRDSCRFPVDVVRSVMLAQGASTGNVASQTSVQISGGSYINDVRDAALRGEAVSEVCSSPEFRDVVVTFKRIKNIVVDALEKGLFIPDAVEVSLFVESTEDSLYRNAVLVAQRAEQYRLRRTKDGYIAALMEIATLRPDAASFLDAVRVHVEDSQIRGNRLALLKWLRKNFLVIADFSEIVVAG